MSEKPTEIPQSADCERKERSGIAFCRLQELGEMFAVAVDGFSVMDQHTGANATSLTHGAASAANPIESRQPPCVSGDVIPRACSSRDGPRVWRFWMRNRCW